MESPIMRPPKKRKNVKVPSEPSQTPPKILVIQPDLPEESHDCPIDLSRKAPEHTISSPRPPDYPANMPVISIMPESCAENTDCSTPTSTDIAPLCQPKTSETHSSELVAVHSNASTDGEPCSSSNLGGVDSTGGSSFPNSHIDSVGTNPMKSEDNFANVNGYGKVIVIEPIDLTPEDADQSKAEEQDASGKKTKKGRKKSQKKAEKKTAEAAVEKPVVPQHPDKDVKPVEELTKDSNKCANEHSGSSITFRSEVQLLARNLAIQAQTSRPPKLNSFNVFTKDTLEALLRFNKRPIYWAQNKKELTLIVLECMIFGCPPKCPRCGTGYPRFVPEKKNSTKGLYVCPGPTTDGKTFAGCDFNADTRDVKTVPWATP